MTTTAPQLELSPVHRRQVRRDGDDLRGAQSRTTTRSSPSSTAQARPRSRLRSPAPSRAFETTRRLPSWKRAEILGADRRPRSTQQRDDFARTIALEAGKPIKTARGEAERAAFTFRVAAEETKRIYGEIVPLDWLPGNEGRTAHVRRVPLGPIAGISPFNFPLNLVAHKVAPALAAGNPIVLRPGEPDADQRAQARADRRSRQAGPRRASPSSRRRRPTPRRSSRTTGSSC